MTDLRDKLPSSLAHLSDTKRAVLNEMNPNPPTFGGLNKSSGMPQSSVGRMMVNGAHGDHNWMLPLSRITLLGSTVVFTAEEEMLDPTEKLSLVESKIQFLQEAQEADLVQLNEYHIYGMALTRLVHGDTGLPYAGAVYNLANSYIDLQMYSQALPHLKQVLTLLETGDFQGREGEARALLPYVYLRTGVCLHHMNKHHSAQTMLVKALRKNQVQKGEENEEQCYFLIALGKAYAAQTNIKKAEEALEKAWLLKDKALGRNSTVFDEEMAQVYIEKAKLSHLKIQMVQEVNRVYKKSEDGEIPEGVKDWLNKNSSFVQKQYKQCVKAYKKAIEIYERSEDGSQDTVLTITNLTYQIGNALWKSRKYNEGCQYLQDAATRYSELCGLDDPHTLHLLKDCLMCQLRYGARSEPQSFATSSLAASSGKKIEKHDSTDILKKLPLEMDLDISDSEFSERDSFAEDSVDGFMSDEDTDHHHHDQDDNVSRSVTFKDTSLDNDMHTIVGKLKKLLCLENETFGEDSPQVGLTFSILGDCYTKLDDPNKAVATYNKASQIYQTYFGNTHPKHKALRKKHKAAHEQFKKYQQKIHAL